MGLRSLNWRQMKLSLFSFHFSKVELFVSLWYNSYKQSERSKSGRTMRIRPLFMYVGEKWAGDRGITATKSPLMGQVKQQGAIAMENKIILIEDDAEISGMVKDYLSGEFTVSAFCEGKTAIRTITNYDEYSLALIDLMLPDISGMEIIKTIRQVSTVPIIIITAKDNDTDKSLGLNLGADDYVVKPFSLIELAARVKANIRRARTYQAVPGDGVVKIKDLEIDPTSHTVTRKGESVNLTPIEFDILHLLASHPGQAYSKERLYELIWKEPYFGNENVLNTHINRLRLKLKSNAEDTTTYIKTLWGIGYKMEEK